MTRPAAPEAGPSGLSRAEHRLLVCLARARLAPDDRDLLRELLAQKIDWEYLLDEAGLHGLRPLLYHHLKETRPEAAPEDFLQRLRTLFHAIAGRNLLLTRELLQLLPLFESAGVPVLCYKGPVLAASVYGNLALREFVDLDLLIHQRDIPKTKELLLSRGYRPAHALTPGLEAFHLKTNNEYKFDRAPDQASVDLHWEVAPKYFHFPIETERLFARQERAAVGGGQVPTLSAADTLLTLCVHGVFHLWSRLEWVCGVAELLRTRGDLDWGLIMAQARRLRTERTLCCGLFLARDLLGAPLAPEVASWMEANGPARELAERARRRLFPGVEGEPGVVEKALYHTRAMDLALSRAAYYGRLAATPNVADWSLLPLPANLFPLYYALRPLRLVASFAQTATRRLLAAGHKKEG